MKNILKTVIILTLISLLFSCQEEEYSYLNVENLKYPTNHMTVVIGLVESDTIAPVKPGGGGFPGFPGFPGAPAPGGSKYKARIKNKAPWLSQPFWGASVEGSRPLIITVANVKTEGENANAEILKQEIKFKGEGIVEIPYDTKIPVGRYLLSYKIANISGSKVIEDCFTVIVTDKKWD